MKKQAAVGAGQRRRAQIVRAAYALMIEYGQLTVQMVADRIDVTDAAVFYHFRTKELLYVELMRYMDEEFTSSRDDLDEIDRSIVALREMEATPNLMTFFLDLATHAADEQNPAHEYFDRRYDAVERRLTDAATVRRPELSPEEVDFRVRLFLAAIDGFQRRWLVQRDFVISDTARVMVQHLFGESAELEAALDESVSKHVLPSPAI